jgi:hypothetical protein
MPHLSDHIFSNVQSFNDPVAVVHRLFEIYANAKAYLLQHFQKFSVGDQQIGKPDSWYP